ncbi:phage tail assembly protein [Agrobacterium salinitolerans]|uniref:Phage tail assembly protein n=1 Tax=Agrobacterium salinitolerans TaxID=1183413 RepID=A0A4Z1R4X7_9HYPH|nr:phage tail assembly protein [Agrobacterium salinitolerans]UYZ08547.1 phage tail assembly protein [Agrobacterium salinitolerans]
MENVEKPDDGLPTWIEFKHTLLFPLKGETGEVKIITLREPDAETLEKIDDIGIEAGKPVKVAQMREILSILSGVPSDDLKRLNRRDFSALADLSGPLLDVPEEEGDEP